MRGWANYYRHVVAKDTLHYHYIDSQIFAALKRWIKKRHPNKSAVWMQKTYFRSLGHRNWLFYARLKGKKPGKEYLHLFTAAKLPIRRYVKIKADATPYDPQYIDYFKQREHRKEITSKAERRWLANFPDMALKG
ncbi:MAG TPA: group II intron maturase-specific domain-containing protein [Legionella sp.]|nr:group II intron maturase-specific domain-containing protein [Legionella sp.]